MLRGVKNLRRGARSPPNWAGARSPLARKAQKRLRGFTLLELMIVISIIMILMAVAVPDLQPVHRAGAGVRSAIEPQHSSLRNFPIHSRQTESSSISR